MAKLGLLVPLALALQELPPLQGLGAVGVVLGVVLWIWIHERKAQAVRDSDAKEERRAERERYDALVERSNAEVKAMLSEIKNNLSGINCPVGYESCPFKRERINL